MHKIGNVILNNQLILAPMAGVNCTAFRSLCKEYGAGLVTTQMFHCNSIPVLYKEDKNKLNNLLGISKDEHPISIQLVGSNPENLAESTKILNNYADIIDFNMGCPDKDILANKSGGFLSKHPEQIEKLIKPIIENSKKPVTAKIRLGWNNNNITMKKQIKILEDLGVQAIAIHGRTVKQKYQGKADWDLIKQAKEIANIPIIGNGDITEPGTAKLRLEQTKVDFVMVGRAALGNPFIFQQINYLLKNNKNCQKPTNQDKQKAFLRFAELYKQNKEQFKLSEFRQHAMWFTKSIKCAKKTRNSVMQLEDYDKIVKLVSTSYYI
jgi:tRNA-dihydrouridine synthase B